MDVFDLRNRLVSDYRRYTRSFIRIRDGRIGEFVDGILGAEGFWPEPLLQLNPTFRPGGTIDDLVEQGVLHPECSRIFRIDKTGTDHRGKQLLLHQHQREAILKARDGRSYVLTTGTGSGKSLAYIVPIVDHVLRRGSGQGVRAIVVYPMNALANSQDEELGKFIDRGHPKGRSLVRFARYTGQERGKTREAIRSNPPDILLTNYMMLELLLTRIEDRELVRAAQGLRFLVFDELHTYRGRQGADVAMLIRRCRHAFGNDIVCVGTSLARRGGGGLRGGVARDVRHREREGEPRAPAGSLALGADAPAVRLHQPLRDGEPQARASQPAPRLAAPARVCLSNSRGSSSGATPSPSSATETATYTPSCSAVTRMGDDAGEWRAAFDRRLPSTCTIRSSSAITRGRSAGRSMSRAWRPPAPRNVFRACSTRPATSAGAGATESVPASMRPASSRSAMSARMRSACSLTMRNTCASSARASCGPSAVLRNVWTRRGLRQAKLGEGGSHVTKQRRRKPSLRPSRCKS